MSEGSIETLKVAIPISVDRFKEASDEERAALTAQAAEEGAKAIKRAIERHDWSVS